MAQGARVVVVLSGAPGPRDEVLAECEGATVIAADGGGNTLAAWGLLPDLVVGDMDSIRPEVLDDFERRGARVLRHPPRKLHTDGALALEEALALGAREVVLVGATGGRLDQSLASFHLMRRGAERGARVRAVDAEGRLWTVTPALPLDLALPVGTTASVLPLTDAVAGVTLTGFAYPLTDARMESDDPYGVSNVASEGAQRVSCASGVLAVIVPRTP